MSIREGVLGSQNLSTKCNAYDEALAERIVQRAEDRVAARAGLLLLAGTGIENPARLDVVAAIGGATEQISAQVVCAVLNELVANESLQLVQAEGALQLEPGPQYPTPLLPGPKSVV